MTVLAQEISHPLGLAARRAIDHRARCALGWQLGFNGVQDVGKFGAPLSGPDFEVQIVTRGAAIQQQQIDPGAGLEMVPDVGHHSGLGRGRQAQHRGRSLIARSLFDEARNIAIIGRKSCPHFEMQCA